MNETVELKAQSSKHTNTNALSKTTSPPPSPSPLEGEGWVGGKINYCVCISYNGRTITKNPHQPQREEVLDFQMVSQYEFCPGHERIVKGPRERR
jgi:hypothetical protein